MIEVEKKFLLSESDRSRLLEGADFLSEKTFSDTYYDDSNYSLTSKDIWMRLRDGTFELKVPLSAKNIAERVTDQYDEISSEIEIKSHLNLPMEKTIAQGLSERKYSPFCTAITTRKKYKINPFVIDLDEVKYAGTDFKYAIAEVELTVESESEMDLAAKLIVEFVKQKKLRSAPIRGKIIEYLKQKKPAHYAALIESNVVKDF